jgi:hypothetical protein
MADNTVLPAGGGGDSVRDIDKGGIKTQVVTLDVGGAGAETLLAGTVPVSGTVTATGPLTDTQLRASPVPVSNASLPLPTGASTAARQDTGNTSLSSIDGKTPALGQALAASSVPVVLTAAQLTTLTPLTSVQANAGTNLNTSLLALEAGHLATIDTSTAKIPSQGQALSANSMPVVLPATQITTLTPPAAITGFALEAGHLATLDANTPTLGQKTGAGSRPVVIASDQTVPISVASLPLPSGAALEAGNLAALLQNEQQNIYPLLLALLAETRLTNLLLQSGLNIREELDLMRPDTSTLQ